MIRYFITFCIYCCFLSVSHAQDTYKETFNLMGSRFDISVVANNQIEADSHIDTAVNEIRRIENLISSWMPTSQTSAININAGVKPVYVDKELFNLIERAIKISTLTNGAFDISYASMDKVWKFDGTMKSIPSKQKIKNSVKKIGYQNIVLNRSNQTVFLKLKGSKIGFGAIGKGYAADKAKELLISNGVESGIINASGDLVTWGQPINSKDWMVAIVNPLDKEKVFAWLPVVNSAVVTSGDYERFINIDGEIFSHIIDPRTGYPSSNIRSVTIFSKTAEIGDALATSVFILGPEVGLDLINQLKGIECLIVDSNNEIITSNNLDLEKANQLNIKKTNLFKNDISNNLSVLKEYEKININDPDMDLNQRKVERFETNFQIYREAAAGANGGKSGGGCGCN